MSNQAVDATRVKEVLAAAAAAEAKGERSKAAEILRQALRKMGPNLQIALQFGQLMEALKQHKVAMGAYQPFLKEGKAGLPLTLAVIRCLIALDKHDEARKMLGAVLKQVPNNAEALTNLAVCTRVKGNAAEAEKLVRKALSNNPKFAPGIHELARVQLALEQPDKAVDTLERNLDREDLYGDSIDLWLDTLKNLKRRTYLRERLKELIKQYPKRPEFRFAYGMLLAREGEIDAARTVLTQVAEQLPKQPRVLYELGITERIRGNIAKSQEIIGRALDLNPEQPAALRTFGVEHKYVYGDREFTRLNTVAAAMAGRKPEEQIQLHFALGKAFDDVGELPTAFKHYAVGGAARRKLEPYNEQGAFKVFNIMKKLLTREHMEKADEPGCDDPTPVFVLGMPRSGTSLLEQVLSSHPDIFGAGELKLMTSAMENINFLGKRIKMGNETPAYPYEANASFEMRGRWYVDELRKLTPPGKHYKRIVDKMPGNFNFAALISKILPKATIIHSQRHPIETCLSCYRIYFSEGQQWSYDLRELGRYYRRYWDLMQHWREVAPNMMLEIRYEDMVADLPNQARKIIDRIGVPWDDNCLRFHETDRPVKTASASQVRKPIYTTSTNRWRKYEEHLQPLIQELGPVVRQYEELIEKSAAARAAAAEKA